jgi:hypothetical protein
VPREKFQSQSAEPCTDKGTPHSIAACKAEKALDCPGSPGQAEAAGGCLLHLRLFSCL